MAVGKASTVKASTAPTRALVTKPRPSSPTTRTTRTFTKPSPSAPTGAVSQARSGATKRPPSTPTPTTPPAPSKATLLGSLPRTTPTGSGDSGTGGKNLPGTKTSPTGKQGDAASTLATAEATVARAEDYFRTTFGRNGHDDSGGRVEVELDPGVIAEARPGSGSQPARIVVGRITDPDTRISRSVAGDLDVIGHEFTHLVIADEASDGEARGSRDYGAIHEGVADVFGAAMERNWQMAHMRDPSTGSGVVTDHDDHGDAGPHERGGVLSSAAARIQEQLGWEVMEQSFYGAITSDEYSNTSDMEDVAALVVAAARREGGSQAASVALAAFRANGLLEPTINPNVR